MELSNKVAIITGASEGIGEATARLFADQGARVVLAARSAGKLAQLAGALPGALSVPTDMRDGAAIGRLIAQVVDHYGRIDILINNAGQGMHVPIAEADIDQYRAIFELNVVGVLRAMQAVIPVMRGQAEGGVIVNISSGTSKMVLPGVGPYASTKYALNAISLTARLELAADGIRVGVVYPGITATDFLRNAASVRPAGPRGANMGIETPQQVAAKILEAVQTEAAETYANTIRPPG